MNDSINSSSSSMSNILIDFHRHNTGKQSSSIQQQQQQRTLEEQEEEPQTIKIALQQQLFSSTESSFTNCNIENYGDSYLISTIDGERIPVISGILAARSPYFATLFYGRFGFGHHHHHERCDESESSKESKSDDTDFERNLQRQRHKSVIELPYKGILLRAIVEYCYTDTVMVTLLVYQREEKKKKRMMEEQKQTASAGIASNIDNENDTSTSTTTARQQKQEEEDRYFGWGFIPSTMMELILVADYFGLRQMCIWIMRKYPPSIWVCLSLYMDIQPTHPLYKEAYELLEMNFDDSILVEEMNELVVPLITHELLERIVADKLINGISEFQLFQLIQSWVNYHENNIENQNQNEDENDEDMIKEGNEEEKYNEVVQKDDETEEDSKEKEEDIERNDDDGDKEELDQQSISSSTSSNNICSSAPNRRKGRTPKSIAKWLIHDHIRLEYIDTKKFQEIVVPSGLISQKGIAKIYQKRLQMLLQKTNNNNNTNTPNPNHNEHSIYYTTNNNDRILEIIRGSYWNTSPGFDEMKTNKGLNHNRVYQPPQSSQQQLQQQQQQHNDFLEFRPMKLRTIHEWSIKIVKSSPRMSFGVILSKESSLHQKFKQRNLQNTNKTTGWLIYEMKQHQQQPVNNTEDRRTTSDNTLATARQATDASNNTKQDVEDEVNPNNSTAEVGGDINDDGDDGTDIDETENDSTTNNDGETEEVDANDDSEELLSPTTTTWSRVSSKSPQPPPPPSSSSSSQTPTPQALPPFIKKYHQGNHFSIVQLHNTNNNIMKDDDNGDNNNNNNNNVLRDGTLIKFKLDLTNQGQLFAKIIQKKGKGKGKKKKTKKSDKGKKKTQKKKKKQPNEFVLLFDNLLVMETDDDDDHHSIKIDGQRSFLPAGAIQGPGKVKFLGIHDRAYL